MPRLCVPPLVSHAPPLGALLRLYAAGSALACEPVEQGLLNRGYRLCTTRGRYFLKHHFDPDTADPAYRRRSPPTRAFGWSAHANRLPNHCGVRCHS